MKGNKIREKAEQIKNKEMADLKSTVLRCT